MNDKLLKLYIRFRHDDRGVTLVEYGCAIALAVSLGTLALATLGTEIGGAMTVAGDLMPGKTKCRQVPSRQPAVPAPARIPRCMAGR